MSVDNSIPVVGELSDVKRKLIDKYLRDVVQTSADQQHIPPRPPGEPVPLSFSQQQVWVHSQMAGDIPIYNEAMTIYRRGPLDVAVLERCLGEILRRHEIWRTTFDIIDGKPIQVVRPAPDEFQLETVDLRYLPESDRAAHAIWWPSKAAGKMFDLMEGPLLRAVLIQMGEEEYRLYLTFHQIVFDAMSAYRIFLPELIALYEAFSMGRPSPLPDPILQYGDFACWQQTALASGAWSEQLSFWRRKLSGEIPVLQWPNERARPIYETHRGAIQRFEFDSAVIASMRAFCKEQGVSSYMIFLASYAALLSRYTGQQDIVLGGLSAGRSRSEIEAVIGYFVNPLALRVDLSGQPTFRQLTSRVRDTVLDALANDEVPFEHVVEAVQPRPNPGRNPLFQIILSQQPQMPAAVEGWDIVSEEVSNGGSKLDLTIVLDERTDTVSGPITYNPNLFDASTIKQMVDHWQTLLAAALADPDRSIAELPLLTEPERHQLLVDWNNTQMDSPPEKLLHELFEAQAERTPDAVALLFESQEMAYRELNDRSNGLASYLQSLGVGPDMPVGLYLERSFDMVVGLLGVLKAGGVCLPLDPTYPKDRLAFMLEETQTAVLITQQRLKADLPSHSAKVVCLDTENRLRSIRPSALESHAASPGRLAYIIYTSGSTGRPKGVQVTHRGLVNSTLAREAYYREPMKSFLLLPSFAFDSSLAGIFWTLSTGGALVLPPDRSRCELSALAELIIKHGVSHLLCVPSLYRELLGETTLKKTSSLSVAIVAGEECSKELVDRHYRVLPDATLYNEYGPTEATVWSSVYRCDPKSHFTRVPIGKPIANAQLYVLDPGLQPVPVGVPGELHIAGMGVTRGYLERPEVNARQFVPNPFGNSGGSLYKSGDLARYLPDGNIEYLGRLDEQVKIRGFRVEVGEIEATLLACPNVRAAVVTLREDLPGDKRLVAYVVPEFRQELTTVELRAFLKRNLPEHMIPAAFVRLETLPLASNGKVDRRALPVPPQFDDARALGFVGPRDDLETRLTKIWEEILGVHGVGIQHNLFELGAHSLLVARMLTRIEHEFGKKLSFMSIFGAPTIEELAALLRNSDKSTQFTKIVPIQPAGTRSPFFLLGGSFFFGPLAQNLGIHQPTLVVNFDEAIVDRLHAPYTFEELASYMAQAIREHQPQGPYFIGGFCDYGLIAYETARQLLNQGHQVALLALFDTCNPAYLRRRSNGHESGIGWSRALFHLKKLRQGTGAEAYRYIEVHIKQLWQRLFKRSSEIPAGIRSPENTGHPAYLERIFLSALEKYDPKPYAGQAAIFRADTKSIEELSGWRNVITGPLELHDILGTHLGMFFDPQVDELGRRLAASIDKVSQVDQRFTR
jgi:surfactin family lipopeptide synthetase A